MKTQREVCVHRHCDNVAISTPDILTIYLTPELALGLANQLVRYAFDVAYSKFPDSHLSTTLVFPDGESAGPTDEETIRDHRPKRPPKRVRTPRRGSAGSADPDLGHEK